MIIDVLGIYPVAFEPCHLIELMVHGHVGSLDVGAFTQECPGQPRSNWQVPWDERVLSYDGTKALLDPFPSSIQCTGKPLRLVFFFHNLDFDRPMITPAGELALQTAEEKPARLGFMVYESPC